MTSGDNVWNEKTGETLGPMERDEFYRMAVQPAFPDDMAFQLTHEDADPDRTFSIEGFEETIDQMQAFVMARSFAYWKKTGKPAKMMRAVLTVRFGDGSDTWLDPITEQDLPYFDIGVIGGLTQLDGEKRIPRTKRKG